VAKNLQGKRVDRAHAYEVWQTPDGTWTWYVLKKWQADDDKQYARWFCEVVTPYTPEGEFGDTYVKDIKSRARRIDVPPQDAGRPESGKVYRLTGANSIASGRTWAESEVKGDA
jgi:hypothetical protein